MVPVSDSRQEFAQYLQSTCGKLLEHRYRIERVLGSGSFGGVLSATIASSGQRVAIKINRRNDHTLRHEAYVFSRLGSTPFTCDVLDAEADLRNTRFLVLSLEKQTITDYLRENADITDAKVAAISIDLIRALNYIHQCGVLHRDVTARNVLIPHSPGKLRVVLCDFGVSGIKEADGRYYYAIDPNGSQYGFYTPLFPMYGRSYHPIDDLYSVVYLLLVLKRCTLINADLNEWQLTKRRLYDDIKGTLPAAQHIFTETLRSIFYYDRHSGEQVIQQCYENVIHHLERIPGYQPDLAL